MIGLVVAVVLSGAFDKGKIVWVECPPKYKSQVEYVWSSYADCFIEVRR